MWERLVIANHLDQSNYLANQQHFVRQGIWTNNHTIKCQFTTAGVKCSDVPFAVY